MTWLARCCGTIAALTTFFPLYSSLGGRLGTSYCATPNIPCSRRTAGQAVSETGSFRADLIVSNCEHPSTIHHTLVVVHSPRFLWMGRTMLDVVGEPSINLAWTELDDGRIGMLDVSCSGCTLERINSLRAVAGDVIVNYEDPP